MTTPVSLAKTVDSPHADDRAGDAGFRVALSLSADSLRSPGRARRCVRTTLTEWGISPDLVESASLIVTELAANAVEQPEAQMMLVIITRVRGRVVLTVIDSGRWREPLSASKAADDDEDGRGLALVEAISDEWGSYPLRGRTAVYAALSVSGGRRRAC